MMEFLSSATFLVPFYGFLKAFFVAMFGLNLGVILTWVERRMRGMIQDSIGPNRAAIPLPGPVAAGAAVGPALLGAAAVVGLWYSLRSEGGSDNAGWGMIFTQTAVFLIWAFTAIMVRVVRARGAADAFEEQFADLGGPRGVVVVGLLTQIGVFALGVATVGTQYEQSFTDLSFSGGMALLVVAMVGTAGFVGARLFPEKEVRVTLLGLLHPAADGLKTAFKNDFEPEKGDKLLYQLAPWISFFPVLVLIAVVPFGPALCFGTAAGVIDFSNFQGIEAVGHACEAARFSLQVADLDVGILYYFAMAGTAIVGAALAGWASDNKFSLLGGMRAASQMVSYEVTLGLTVIGALMIYGSVRIDDMVRWQAENAWGIFVQPFGFFLFLAAAIAETKRVPFDIPEGESEIVAGYFTEYAGMKFSMFFFGEFVAVISSSTLMAALFFGGWHLPFETATGIAVTLGETTYFSVDIEPSALAVLGFLTMIVKVVALCVFQIIIRWTLPRFRYDQLMRLGWRKLLPASLVNVMLTATFILAIQSASSQVQSALDRLGELSMLALGLAFLAGNIALIVFLMTPRQKQRLVVSSSARYAEAMGGIHSTKMEA